MAPQPLAVIILAAGLGTRMKSDQPKALLELAGLPMVNWIIRAAEALSPDKIIVVTGPDMPGLSEAAAPHETAVQPVANGTGGAVMAALPALDGFQGDVLILLGDTPLLRPATLEGLKNARQDAPIAILGMELDNPSGYGRLITDKKGQIIKIVEEKDASDEERQVTIVNSGAFCVEADSLRKWLPRLNNENAQGEFYITDLPALAAADGAHTNVTLAPDAQEVMGANTKVDLALLEARMQDRLRRQHLMNGVTMLDPATVYLHHDTRIASGVLIEPSVFFGPGVEIETGAHIKAYSHIEGASIGENVTVGPFARLRPGTSIEAESRIGNFVEVKKSTIGQGSKINHLAYVGDTEMGENVNFSAGAITVNYDGFQKHKTVIGKDVMVGSNVNLVAPINIDDGAFIAAGTTLNVDVPADSLSIARDAAKIRKGWALEYRKRKKSGQNNKKSNKKKVS